MHLWYNYTIGWRWLLHSKIKQPINLTKGNTNESNGQTQKELDDQTNRDSFRIKAVQQKGYGNYTYPNYEFGTIG